MKKRRAPKTPPRITSFSLSASGKRIAYFLPLLKRNLSPKEGENGELVTKLGGGGGESNLAHAYIRGEREPSIKILATILDQPRISAREESVEQGSLQIARLFRAKPD